MHVANKQKWASLRHDCMREWGGVNAPTQGLAILLRVVHQRSGGVQRTFTGRSRELSVMLARSKPRQRGCWLVCETQDARTLGDFPQNKFHSSFEFSSPFSPLKQTMRSESDPHLINYPDIVHIPSNFHLKGLIGTVLVPMPSRGHT